jgi:hypothetical protein
LPHSAESGAEPRQKARVRRLHLLTAQRRKLAEELVFFLRQLDGRVHENGDEKIAPPTTAKSWDPVPGDL